MGQVRVLSEGRPRDTFPAGFVLLFAIGFGWLALLGAYVVVASLVGWLA